MERSSLSLPCQRLSCRLCPFSGIRGSPRTGRRLSERLQHDNLWERRQRGGLVGMCIFGAGAQGGGAPALASPSALLSSTPTPSVTPSSSAFKLST